MDKCSNTTPLSQSSSRQRLTQDKIPSVLLEDSADISTNNSLKVFNQTGETKLETMSTSSVQEATNPKEGDLMESTNDFARALYLHGNLLRLLNAKDIKAKQREEMRQDIKDLLLIINTQEKQISILNTKLEIANSSRKSYADVLKPTSPTSINAKNIRSRSRSRPKQNYTNAVIIKPKCEQSSETTFNELKKTVNPKDINVHIEGIKKINGGGIVIQTNTAEEAKTMSSNLTEATSITNKYEISLPKKRNPQIILHDVSKEIDSKELKNLIIEYNDNITDKDLEIKKDFISKSGNKNWIIEITPKLTQELTDKKIRIGWQRVSFRDYIRPTRCYNCGRYGHIGKFCKNRTSCMRCGSVEHLLNQCTEKEPKCVNCTEHNYKYKTTFAVNHYNNSITCKCWKKEKDRIISRTDYG